MIKFETKFTLDVTVPVRQRSERDETNIAFWFELNFWFLPRRLCDEFYEKTLDTSLQNRFQPRTQSNWSFKETWIQ